MVKSALPIALAATLAGCLSSSETSLQERYDLQVAGLAYENRMPMVIFPGEPVSCSPSLIVGFAVRANKGTLPSDLKAHTVTLRKAGARTWQQEVSSSETGLVTKLTTPDNWLSDLASVNGIPPANAKEELILRGVARGCRNPDFQEGDTLELAVQLTAGPEEASPAVNVQLGAAY